LKELTEDRFEIEILTESDYREKYNPELKKVGGNRLINMITAGDIEMSQIRTHNFSVINRDFLSFDMPFLFKSHNHATKVFEGEIGKQVLDSLYEKGGIQGLAFTYSGGFRVIGSNHPITEISQIKGKSVRVNTNPVNYDYMQALGANPVKLTPIQTDLGPTANYGWDEIDSGDLDATETTYLRFKGKYILKSEHNMFLTTIVTSGRFWNTLDAETKELFRKAALEASRLERKWSLEDAKNFETTCSEQGVTIFDISEQDRSVMKDAIHAVYEKWQPKFTDNLISDIKKLAN
jgi:TRAP-type C4-dicarboxylate transport system substrate-binding protein